MRNTIEGFNQPVLIQLKISASEAVFLRWMLSYMASGKTKKIVYDEHTYDWIKYSKAMDDLPILFKNIFAVRRMISNLASTSPGEKPLLIHLVHTVGKGVETFFRFDPDILDQLESTKMDSLIDGLPITNKPIKDKEYKKIPAYENILTIFQRLKKLHIDGKPLFSHESPIDSHHYSKVYAHFQDAALALYEGRFTLSQALKFS